MATAAEVFAGMRGALNLAPGDPLPIETVRNPALSSSPPIQAMTVTKEEARELHASLSAGDRGPVRVYMLAQSLGVDTGVVLATAHEAGFAVRNQLDSVTPEQREEICRRLAARSKPC